jgi:acyl-CoA reductase-like NAD-dependent aldehyde dehydrogenase
MSKPSRTVVVDNPFSGATYCEVPLAGEAEAVALITRSAAAQKDFAQTQVAERVALVGRFAEAALSMKETIARDISGMMGKPIAQARGEVDTLVARSRYMASVAEEALADVLLPAVPNFHRKVIREPLGVVLDIAPWNYPLLTAVNAVVPAVLAGNSVVLKHASRTPLCGDHFVKAFEKAGAPRDLVTSLNADHEVCAAMIARPEVGFVAFTGSVPGGHQVYANAARRFIDAGLELGGKDPGYVAPDADFDHAVANLVDGAFYNAGQSCCGIERIYVHESLYARFLDAAVAQVKQYRLGDPMDEATTLGPLAQPGSDAFLAKQVDEARSKGARVLCGGAATKVNGMGRFFDPCVVADATHGMSIMVEESFGPVVGIGCVRDDEEALRLMNDSPYGLTCAIWTSDEGRAERMARRLETGTVFMNRCDYLDPALPWVGVKDSGKGLTLSKWGFQALTRMKSLHFRLSTR